MRNYPSNGSKSTFFLAEVSRCAVSRLVRGQRHCFLIQYSINASGINISDIYSVLCKKGP